MNDRIRNTKVKSALLEASMTQRDLSEKTAVREEYISMAIRGKYILDEMQRIKIAAALGKRVEELF